jgi:hypothetical protein
VACAKSNIFSLQDSKCTAIAEMALIESMEDGRAVAAANTAHERCTTIVPVACMLRLPAPQTEDPSSRLMQQAAQEKFDMSQMGAVVTCLSRVEGNNATKLKRCVGIASLLRRIQRCVH